jgi:hypothetical protein
MTTTLKPTPVAIRQFTWDSRSRTLTAFMSDTHGFGQVYPDSCDEGLTVVGATGREIVFHIAADHHDRESELTHWTLEPANTADRATVAKMVIFND